MDRGVTSGNQRGYRATEQEASENNTIIPPTKSNAWDCEKEKVQDSATTVVKSKDGMAETW